MPSVTRLLVLLLTLASGALVAVPAGANTSHAGWPFIDGMLLMNKLDQDRPLDARPGRDPFVRAHARRRDARGPPGAPSPAVPTLAEPLRRLVHVLVHGHARLVRIVAADRIQHCSVLADRGGP